MGRTYQTRLISKNIFLKHRCDIEDENMRIQRTEYNQNLLMTRICIVVYTMTLYEIKEKYCSKSIVSK